MISYRIGFAPGFAHNIYQGRCSATDVPHNMIGPEPWWLIEGSASASQGAQGGRRKSQSQSPEVVMDLPSQQLPGSTVVGRKAGLKSLKLSTVWRVHTQSNTSPTTTTTPRHLGPRPRPPMYQVGNTTSTLTRKRSPRQPEGDRAKARYQY